MFTKHDEDKSGAIDRQEFAELVEDLGGGEVWTEEELDEAFASIDAGLYFSKFISYYCCSFLSICLFPFEQTTLVRLTLKSFMRGGLHLRLTLQGTPPNSPFYEHKQD